MVGRSVTAIPRFLSWARPKLKMPRIAGKEEEEEEEEEKKKGVNKKENEHGVPVPGVLYVTGLEPAPPSSGRRREEEEEEEYEEFDPDFVYPITEILAPVYTGACVVPPSSPSFSTHPPTHPPSLLIQKKKQTIFFFLIHPPTHPHI